MLPSALSPKLILGTAQLGQNYGVANTTGRPDQQSANDIVRCALDGGISLFDTAQGYGESEAVLGHALGCHDFERSAKVITKLPPVPPEEIGEVQNLAELIWDFENHGSLKWKEVRKNQSRLQVMKIQK